MKKRFILITIILLNIFILNVDAEIKPSICEVSDEYLKWLALPEDERSQIMMPDYCKDLSKKDIQTILPEYSVSPFANNADSTTIPSSFDLRNVNGKNYVTSIKNQKQTGTCWAHAGLSAIESNILLKHNTTYDFSELHLSYSTSANYFSDGVNYEGNTARVAGGGGNYEMTSSYLSKLKGPILETEFPFNSYYDTTVGEQYNYNVKEISLSQLENKTTLVDVNNIDWYSFDSCTDEALNLIKKTIMEKGAVQASYYSDSEYTNGSYLFHNGTEETNHAITLVGWDDSISKTKFKSGRQPSSNGAFIMKNSWGTSSGNSGYYYISYEDTNICKHITSYNNIDFEIEDNVYYYDTLGHWGGYGWGDGQYTAWAANSFKKNNDKKEVLTEVTIGTRYNTDYEIYISFVDENGETDLYNRELIGAGNFNHEGYGTHKLEEPILIDKDFSIIVKYTGVDKIDGWPVAVQASIVEGYENSILELEQSYASLDGEYWIDLKEAHQDVFIPSIKAYTNNIEYDFSIGEVVIEDESIDKFKIPVTLTNITNASTSEFTIKVFDSNDVDVTEEFIIKDFIKANNYVEIEKKSFDTENGEYKVEISYDLLTYDTIIQVTNSNPTLEISGVNYNPYINYTKDYKIYNKSGGTVSIPIFAHNLVNNELSVEIKNSLGEIQEFEYNGNTVVNNNTELNITIPKDTLFGTYSVRVYNDEIEGTVDFVIYEFIEVDDIIFKYNETIIDEVTLLKNHDIKIDANISNSNSTLKEISLSIENSSDIQIASITIDGVINGINVGTTNLVASVGEQKFIIPLTVISVPSLTYDYGTKESYVSGNNLVDNYFGGKYNFVGNYENVTTGMEFKHNIIFDDINEDVTDCFNINSVNSEEDNKLNLFIETKKECLLSDTDNDKNLSVGNYKISTGIVVNDTANTVIMNYSNINAIQVYQYVPLETITSNLEKINLKVGDEYQLSNFVDLTIEPNDATNKNIKYVGYDEEVISIDDEGVVTALKGGITSIKVQSVYKEDVYDTINVMVNPNIKKIETNIQSNYNNILYYGYGGKVITNITTENIMDNEKLTLTYYKDGIKQDDMTNIFDTSNPLVNNNSVSVNFYISDELEVGKYKVEFSYDKASIEFIEFEVIEPIKVTSIEASDIIIPLGIETNINYKINPGDALIKDVEFDVADTSIVKVEDGKIKGLKVGNTTLSIKSKDGSNVEKTVNVDVIQQSILISNIELENDVIYETIGGKLYFRTTLINIDSNEVNIDIIDKNDKIVYNAKVSINDEGYRDVELDVPKELEAGTYTIKVTTGNFESSSTFHITTYKSVENINFMYIDKELSKVVLTKEDEIVISSIITNDNSTFKDIDYSIKDASIATVSENGLISGLKVGKTDLIAKVGYQEFVLPIEIIEIPKVTYGSINIYSNVVGNKSIDNHYGGKYTINAIFENINSQKGIIYKSISLKDSTIKNFGTFEFKSSDIINNKSLFEVTFKEYQSNPSLSSGIINASGGKYIISYGYVINDTKETEFTDSFEIELKDYVCLKEIKLDKNNLSLDVNESIDISKLINFEPDNTTNKNIKYEVSNTSILRLNGSNVKALKEGTAKIYVQSLDNENIKVTINVNVEENEYLEFDKKISIYNDDNVKYLKGLVENSTYKDLKNSIQTNLKVVLKNKNGDVITENDELVGTGMKLIIGDITYNIVIKGDLNGNGKVTVTDLSQLRFHLAEAKGKIKTGAEKIAADLNDKSGVTVTDLSQMRKKLAGVK